MKKSCNKMLRIVMSMAAAMLLVMIMSASAFAAEANENVKNASAGVVHIRVMYQGDGTDYDIQWGSGFLVNDMTVLTCFHVVYVDDATIGLMREDAVFGPLVEGKTDKQIRDRIVIKVTVYQDSSVSAEVAEGVSSENGDYVALKLKSPLADYTPLPIRDSNEVDKTELCNALGFPFKMVALKGFNVANFTQDAVEITPGSIKNKDTNDIGVMNIYMAGSVSEGYSGGPLVDDDGNVIGIICKTDDNQTYATASQEFLPVLKTLGIDYTSAGESSEPEPEPTPTETEPVPEPTPEPAAEKPSMTPYIIGGIAALLIIIVAVVLLLTRKKKGDTPTPAGTYPTAGPTPAVPQTGTGSAAGAAPKVPPAASFSPRPETGVLGQGSNETTVLGQGAGETTVLSSNKVSGSLTRSKTGEKINITRDNFKIGRERSKVDYCISDNTAIGRHHATIVSRNGEAYLVDQNSRNFTFVNNVKVPANTETKLNNGDKITFGDEEYTYNA